MLLRKYAIKNALFSHFTYNVYYLHYLGKQETQKWHLFTSMVHAVLPTNTQATKNITWPQPNHLSLSK